MDYLQDKLFFTQLSRFQRLYAKSLTMRLAPYDVQPGYLTILHYLWQRDKITQKELNQHVAIEQATLSNTLKRMERDGLIQREPNRKDRRRHLITLTPKGISLKTPVSAAIDDLRKTVNQGLTINDRRYFKRIMNQMTTQLEDDQSDSLFVLLDEVTE